MIFGKNYNKLEFEDIQRLVDNKISESRSLDYKREINLDKGDSRKEFLYDVTSFINSDGGALVYGISELKDENGQNTGLPDEITGIDIDNFDKLTLKIEDLIKTSIEPNIPNVVIKPLEKNGKKILIIGLPKPFGLPRMVTYNSTNKFYRRRNSGKYLVDIYELNQMFMQNVEIINEVEKFRRERVEKLKKGEFISNFDSQNFTVIHVIPISFFKYNQISLTDDRILNDITTKLKPLGVRDWDYRHNFEGYLIFSHNKVENKVIAFNQIFRNGIIEFITHVFHSEQDAKKYLHLGWLETQVIECVKNAIEKYKEFEIPPPFAVYISITDLINRLVEIGGVYNIRHLPFLTNELFLPNIIINDFDENIEKQLKNMFDIIWQSAGYKKSPFYNEIGERKSN